ncbi:hypothetical protein F5X96DRAFT_659429 [Biscogniauxia mediterranea]|nr:hypothetical protein F5X96DRAFT_659429 [Biscogniauxia mediterranea]
MPNSSFLPTYLLPPSAALPLPWHIQRQEAPAANTILIPHTYTHTRTPYGNMMASQSRPQVFARAPHHTSGQDVRFPLFPQLPTELRLKIWQLSLLERQRLIKVHLMSRTIMDLLLIAHRNEEPEPDSHHGENSPYYCAIVDGAPMRSKLMRVNAEARRQALAFYRVRIPCRFGANGFFSMGQAETAPGTLYFNPEHDFLHVRQQTNGEFVRFVHDLKTTYDPRHVGLLNLAIDSTGLTGSCGMCLLDPGELEPELRREFAATLRQLREVFFVSVQGAGRHTGGILGGGAPTDEFSFNRAFPVMAAAASTSGFERLARDPRPVADHLRRVFVGSDPRPMVRDWQRLLASFDVSEPPPPKTQHRFLLSFEPSPRAGDTLVRSREIAEDLLMREEQIWSDIIAVARKSGRRDILDQPGETAFGFWLFPLEFLDGLPQTQTMVDVTEHWPELGLVSLP